MGRCRTLDVEDYAAGSADEVMVVVADPSFVAEGPSREIESSKEARTVQRVADVVAGLDRHRDARGANTFDDFVHT